MSKNKRNVVLVEIVILIAIIALAIFAVVRLSSDDELQNNSSSQVSSSQEDNSSEQTNSNEETNSSEQTNSGENVSSETPVSSNQSTVSVPDTLPHNLDKNFENLTLVNGWNPLPDDFDYEGHLTTIPQKYIKGSLTQIDKDVWPYLQAMLDDARAEGIDIGVWSPYRSYATQKMLFERQVQKQINNGVPKENAEDVASTIVARPGTSEHNTGLALDINCANHSFANTKAFKWLQENAADYGFIMRYAEDKQEKTGVIYESWHWRFVGVKAAYEINDLGMCLEEYVEYRNKQ
jgi:D-alanyl-D-alanine carboxypeptidase